MTVGAQNFDLLPRACERNGNLTYFRVLGTQIGVYLLQKLHLGIECRRTDGVFIRVKVTVRAGRCRRIASAIALKGCRNRIGSALQGGKRKIARMGIADGFACDRAQAESLILIEGAGLETTIVENKRLRLAIFHEEALRRRCPSGFGRQDARYRRGWRRNCRSGFS